MQFLTEMFSYLNWVLPFLFVLGIVVFVHEMGHFLAARWCGVAVETFSIGFGQEIAGFNDRHGTRWRLAWIPLGGYVKFKGDENAASMPASREELSRMTPEQRRGNFHLAPLSSRAIIVAAGPIANFILAFIVFAILFGTFGKPLTDPVIGSFVENSAAKRSGFLIGDRIVSIDGNPIISLDEVQRAVMLGAESPMNFRVVRAGEELSLSVMPEARTIKAADGSEALMCQLGISAQNTGKRAQYGAMDAIAMSAKETYFWLTQPLIFIKKLIVGSPCVSASQLGGPIGIAKVAEQVASFGIAELIRLTAIISVSIGLLNLFPIPVLDGGHLLYYGIEAIVGRPLSQQTQEFGFRIGLALLLMLMIFSTWNDVSRIFLKSTTQL
ncbi:MAG: RIP metalloprotease RseP [Hyphomicrobiales bacterium]|nr:RIP metalloprotease RseP [Hyphomicrobiales bacterium]